MPREWTGSGLDLVLDLDPGLGRRAALEAALRTAIRDGRLAPGAALPSSRALAVDLGVARGTVTAAYEQLVAEGWLVTRPGATTAVARGARPPGPAAVAPGTARWWRHDFHPGMPDLGAFPRQAWAAAMRHALHTAADTALGYEASAADLGLADVLAEHAGRARGVVATPERVVMCGGFVHALAVLGGVLRDRGVRAVAVEDPCLFVHREVLAGTGLRVVPVPVDDRGLRTDVLASHRVGAVVVTPAHHFPLGVALAAERRAELLAWAAASDAVIIEDDYDGELRYDRKPLGALQALAPDRVVYCSTASKALAPGLRLGWMVVPASLIDGVVAARDRSGRAPSTLDQLALAELLRNGAFGRHVRRQRSRYRRRRDHLVDVLTDAVPGIRFHGLAAGLRALIELPPGSADEPATVDAAARRGLRILPIQQNWVDAVPPPGLIAIGYGAPPDHAYRDAVDQLAAVLREAAHSASASPSAVDGGAPTHGHSSSAMRRQSAVAPSSASTA